MDLINFTKDCINKTERNEYKLSEEIINLEGMSSKPIRTLLNNICELPETKYLEIGSWKGSTILSASYKNPGKFIAIDDFSQFNDNNYNPRKDLLENQNKFRNQCNFNFYESNCWDFNLTNIKDKINVYFYDGDHACDSQYRAYVHFNSILDNKFITMVDDWNWDFVRQGTLKAFEDLKYNVIYSKEYFTTPETCGTWWNGFYICVIEKS